MLAVPAKPHSVTFRAVYYVFVFIESGTYSITPAVVLIQMLRPVTFAYYILGSTNPVKSSVTFAVSPSQ